MDSGFDISNYTDINPLFGSLGQFDEFIEGAHDRDLKVILDIVPNHSSDKHEWFSLSTKGVDPYRDYYVWSNGSVDDNGNSLPPNNWASTYSDEEGSAWTWHDSRKQWYYHKFHKSQPDLNLRNENVSQELLDVFDFWLRRGVDGFRINGVSYLYEDEELRNEPVSGNGTYTSGLPENTALLYKFRMFIDDWVDTNNASSKLLIAESYDSDQVLIDLYGNETYKGIPPLNFRFITCIQNTSTAENISNVLKDWLDILPSNTSTNWVLSNHDNSRVATRIGLNRVDGLHMVSLLLPGQAFTYYGEEIAMLDRNMSWNETIDPMGCARSNETYAKYSRDPARTPMQWNCNVSSGFSTNATTYLPLHPDYVQRNVETQQDGKSNLKTYKLLTALRKDKVFTHGGHEFAGLNNDRVFVLKRFLENYSTYIVVVNLGLRLEIVNLTSLYPNLEDSMEIIVASSNAVYAMDTVSGESLTLTANAAFLLKAEEIIPETTTESSTESSTEPSTESSTETSTESSTESSTETSTTSESTTPAETSTTPISTSTEPTPSAAAKSISTLHLIISTSFTVILLFRL